MTSTSPRPEKPFAGQPSSAAPAGFAGPSATIMAVSVRPGRALGGVGGRGSTEMAPLASKIAMWMVVESVSGVLS